MTGFFHALFGGEMGRHCEICGHQLEPSDKKCRRCGSEVESQGIFWLLVLVGLCSIGVIAFGVHRLLIH